MKLLLLLLVTTLVVIATSTDGLIKAIVELSAFATIVYFLFRLPRSSQT